MGWSGTATSDPDLQAPAIYARNGPASNASDVSYRLLGPTLIVEYACLDLGSDPLDHLHSMYRNPRSAYGAAFATTDRSASRLSE